MSTTTPYLGLTLYDSSGDQSVTFATFRAVWGGTATTSNFYKIDTGMSGFNTRISNLEATRPAVVVPALFISANFYQATGISSITGYSSGMTIILSVDTTSNGTVTLDINSLGTKSVMKVNSSGTAINLTGSDLVKGRQYLFVYDGTNWLWVSANSADQIQIVGTAGNVVTVGSTNNLLGTTTQAGLIADTTHAATGKTTLVGADEIGIEDSAASYVLKKAILSDLQAYIFTDINYQISRTISSNNLVVALKNTSGANFSSTNPFRVKIGTTMRQVTGALSVTVNAGSSVFNLGSTELAVLPQELFVYLGYRASDTSVFMLLSRIPYALTYGDFTSTSTDERYGAYSGSAPATSDVVEVIGRINVQNSGTASYNWSIPGTDIVLNYPVWDTSELTWNPTFTGFSANPTGIYRYKINKNQVFALIRHSANGTSNATTFTITAPFTSINIPNGQWGAAATADDNSVSLTTPVLIFINANSATITASKDWSVTGGGAAWTNTAGKRIRDSLLIYEI